MRPRGEAPHHFLRGLPAQGHLHGPEPGHQEGRAEKERIVVTGDIGCTILGMNPPFHSCWTEVSMGSSIGLAQGFLRAGMPAPVVPTIGDSTFFHAGSRLAPRGT
jgi:indolepyruvate ferredoxin oxidoreductase alpha subunit